MFGDDVYASVLPTLMGLSESLCRLFEWPVFRSGDGSPPMCASSRRISQSLPAGFQLGHMVSPLDDSKEETSPLFRRTEHTHTSMHVLHLLRLVYIHPSPLPTPDVEQQNDSSRERRHLEA